ncbi:MAG: Rrf2 family transcriptional regulator [Succinivibrio sp.]|nr:Rrf2 family transcriptional regulator [Succinivibrio sp.]MBQ8477875.1 Rrf2 family transcriptional regulator [Succinivibrio sp.]MCI5638937.1 Rrf2 family transcriptional regulator [Succinivibrio sp.]MCI6449614.1 Rrf2 family transcriptional regulator [Succinivibrio sp.]MCI7773325.1 Rrf2 family transcriptional regulator [Succinivibrio sp.]
MKISTKGRYALRMMIELAQNHNVGFMTLKEIAQKQNISKKYLEQIIPVLNRNNFLIATRGFQGGYKLAKEPCEYTVGQILRLTEGNLAPVSCLECTPNTCPRANECPTLFLWEGLYKVVNEYLDSITLEDLVQRQKDHLCNDYII